jgi:hypothetical protein
MRRSKEISSVLPIDEVREGQHEEVKAGWLLRKPPGLGFALLSSEFAAFSFALTTLITSGLDDEEIVGIQELLPRGSHPHREERCSFVRD